jgi:protein-S-isoprenylcysteine O-methyltransferase Ste14
MSTDASATKPETPPEMTRLIARRLIQVLAGVLVQAVVLFAAAGRLDWAMGWAYVGVNLGIVAFNMVVLLPTSPELIAERGRVKENVAGWDRLLAPAVSLVGPLTTLVVSALDGRFGWPVRMPLAVEMVGLVVAVAGYLMFTWSMASNKFFAGVVRIQTERGHTVETGGPYRYVRHPGYAGMIIFTLATPVLLGSVWGLIPAGLTVAVVVLRTTLEDRTLQAELGGYEEYAGQVRYRLVPGVW